MKKIIGIVVLVILIIWGLSAMNGGEKMETGPIKIGVVAPLSGDVAFIGEGLREAMEMALEDLNETKYTYELIFEDDQLDPKMTVTAANKLVSIDNVNALVSISSGSGNVVSPIAQENGIPHISIASDSNIATGEYNFIHWTTPAEEARVLVEELKNRDITKIALLRANHQGFVEQAEFLQNNIEGTDIEVVVDEKFNTGETDFKTLIAKTKDIDAEAYLLMAFSPELEILAKQVRDAQITTPFIAIEAFELTEQRELFEGEWYVGPADPTDEFANNFKERTGGEVSVGAGNGYDVFNLFVAAVEKTDTSSKTLAADIASELSEIKGFKGVLGTLDVGENGIVWSEATVKMIKDGQPVTISVEEEVMTEEGEEMKEMEDDHDHEEDDDHDHEDEE